MSDMFKTMPTPSNPPKSVYPSISIYQDFLDGDSWSTLDWYVRNTDPLTWGFTESMDKRPPTATRFHTVKHSKDESIEYLRSEVFDDETFEKIKSGQMAEPFPEGLENYEDWNLVLHQPIEQKILDIITKLDSQINEQIFSLFGQKAQNTFPPVFTKIENSRSMRMHTDGYDFNESSPTAHRPCHFASIYYLNDDYEGGEHCTPYIGLSFKPKPNSLILNCTPWDEDMAHRVNSVTKGVRYVRQHFWLLDES